MDNGIENGMTGILIRLFGKGLMEYCLQKAGFMLE